MHICFLKVYFFAAGSVGSVELLESMLLLSAEMDDGLGLLVTTRPHGKTAAQLLQQMLATKSRWHELWVPAAQNGHVSLLEWLHHNFPALPENELYNILRLSALHGQVAVLKWTAHSPKYVFTALRMRACALGVNARAVMPLCT